MTENIPAEKLDIAAVMAADPMSHTRKDIAALIAYMRSVRHTFNAGPKPKKKAVTKTAAAKKKTLAAAGEIKLGDLF